MKRKQKHRTNMPPVFVFTPKSIALTQDAMKLYEQGLQRATGEPSKLAFAKEMLLLVNSKLDSMSTSLGHLCLTTFDHNEKIVIATAMQLYRLDLLATPATVQREGKLKLCEHIQRFAQDHLKAEPVKTKKEL